LEKLKAEIVLRDEQDSSREFAPLKRAEDAEEIDTSSMSIEEVLAFLKSKMQERI